METEIKKRKRRKGGTDYAKEKLAKAEAKVKELENKLKEEVREHQTLEQKYKEALNDIQAKDAAYTRLKKELNKTIEKQGTTISQLTADKANLESDAKFHEASAKKYWNAMGCIRRWWYEKRNC